MRSKDSQEPSIGADPFRHKKKREDWDSSIEKDRRRVQETKTKKRERPLMAQTEKASGNQDREEE